MNSCNISNNIKEELKQMKSKDIFENLKGRYLLKKIFDNLQRKKSLEIIKYNKNIKKELI